ncbi:MAG: penicillin acylase family protein [Myxococcota bacterium]|nr:penicillin acylase family protein [Myxococcota bacterium]
MHVVRTEMGIPHIYAESRVDLSCALGFVTARDRFFQMDLISRNGLGTLGELLGDQGLGSDISVRSRGGARIAQNMLDAASAEERAAWDAYAAGVNAYIDEVRADLMPAPEELEIVYVLLGKNDPSELMFDWTALNVAGVASTINFVSGFETTDIRLQQVADQLETWGLDKLQGELRNAGAIADLWNNIVPVYPVASAPDFLTEEREAAGPNLRLQRGAVVEQAALQRAVDLADQMDRRFGRGPDTPGWGSNMWSVAPELSADGHALLASDGHLALTSPAFLYQLHVDTELLGGGDIHTIGLTVAGAPMVGLGHNGSVAWGHTSQVSDINDYYREVVVLGTDGRPSATLFQGAEVAVEEISETYTVSDALGTLPGDRVVSRWVTGSGRPLFSLEGTPVASSADDPAAVNIFGTWIVAGDVDGDGLVTAISGAATHYSEAHMVEHVLGWGSSADVDEWGSHLAGMTSYSQHFVAADTSGNILYSGFQAMPCRGYLPRDAQGVPLDGANPQRLIDGTLYPSFEVLYDENRRIDPAKDSEINCTLSWDEYPHSKNPEQGYLFNSNNAGAGLAWDNDIWNDEVYLGGPWYGTWRGTRIAELIEEGAGTHTVDSMSAIQGDHKSRMATEFLPQLLESLAAAEQYAASEEALPGSPAERMGATWLANESVLEEAGGRLEEWQARGLTAASGVETLYDSPSDEDRRDAVATMIFNAWMGRFLASVFDDEGLPSVFRPTGSYGRTRALKSLLDGVGPNASSLVSLDPATGESVFFDVLGTEIVESAEELALDALVDALAYLASDFSGDRTGGFGTEDQEQWLWGLKHFVEFESFIAREVSGDELIAGIFGPMAITPEVLPLSDPEPGFGDLRRGLPGFPRPGDAFAVDAAGGISTHDFSYGSGPVMRMAFSMDPDGVHGVNIIPGGQAADPDSPHFADQAELWIANEALPVRFYLDDVIAAATGREVLRP